MSATIDEFLDRGEDKERVSFDPDTYPHLAKYASLMEPPARPVIGRDEEIERLLASLKRPELSNAFLLGDPGSGKTMLVQGASVVDKERIYVEVDLAKMSSSEQGEDGVTQMATRVKSLFDEVVKFRENTERLINEEIKKAMDAGNKRFRKENHHRAELVLFIDEFHLLIQLSAAAAQAIKPILAESGHNGVRIIAATTFAEFHDYVEKDQALMQRLQRINIREPGKDTVISILKSVAKTHGVFDEIYDKQLYELIYEFSGRYIPSDSQPRKSILLLDSMIGWYRMYPEKNKLDRHLLASVVEESSGVRVAFNIDGRAIQKTLDERVFSQGYATAAIERRLQIAVADLHDKSRPISSFLFTGPTGVGKTELAKGLANVLFGSDRAMIRFDMSEFALEDSLDRFRHELTNQVWNKSHSVILFDEIEKANQAITRLLLQVLDDGRLTNAQGREVSFLNTYIVLTTNAATEVYKDIAHYDQSDDGSEGLAAYQKVIRRSLIADEAFAPEIINRMNAIIPFQPLSSNTYKRIVIRKLQQLKDEVYRIHGVRLSVHQDIVDYLVYEVFDIDTDSGGARGLMAQLDSEVVSPVSRYINQHPDVKHIGVHVQGRMAHKHEDIRESEASVIVGTVDAKRARRES